MEFHRLFGQFMMKFVAGNRNPKLLEGKKRIACVGDSITFGHGVHGKTEETWEYYLNSILGDAIQVINYGASGRTLQKEGDYPYTEDRLFRRSLECGAEVVLILLGTNDAKPFSRDRERFERNYEAFVRRYTDLPNAPRVIVMTPPQVYGADGHGVAAFGIHTEILERNIVEAVKDTAKKMNLQMIDLHEYTKDHPEWFTDGVHPNAAGNRAFAKRIAEELNL